MFVGKTLLANLPALLLQDIAGLPEVEQALFHGLAVFLRRRRDRVVRLLSDRCGTARWNRCYDTGVTYLLESRPQLKQHAKAIAANFCNGGAPVGKKSGAS